MSIAAQFIYKYGDVDSPYYFYKFMADLEEASKKSF